MEKLTSAFPDDEFRWVDYHAELERGGNQLNAAVRIFGWAGMVALIIICCGTLGIALVFMEKRKKEFAIHYLNGLSIRGIKRQVYLEFAIVYLIGYVTASAAAFLVQPLVSSIYYPIAMHWQSVAILFAVATVVPLMISLLSMGTLSENRAQLWIHQR